MFLTEWKHPKQKKTPDFSDIFFVIHSYMGVTPLLYWNIFTRISIYTPIQRLGDESDITIFQFTLYYRERQGQSTQKSKLLLRNLFFLFSYPINIFYHVNMCLSRILYLETSNFFTKKSASKIIGFQIL